jgi:hypothetical protein
MRIAVLAVTAMLAASAHAAQTEKYRSHSTAELVAICSTPASEPDHQIAVAFCHGILAGAYGFYVSSTPVSERFVCAPNPPPTRSQVAQDFVAWAKKNPQYMNDGGIDTLFRYAAQNYPCKR